MRSMSSSACDNKNEAWIVVMRLDVLSTTAGLGDETIAFVKYYLYIEISF